MLMLIGHRSIAVSLKKKGDIFSGQPSDLGRGLRQ